MSRVLLLHVEVTRDDAGHWVTARFSNASNEPYERAPVARGPYKTLAEAMTRLARFTVIAAADAKAAGL